MRAKHKLLIVLLTAFAVLRRTLVIMDGASNGSKNIEVHQKEEVIQTNGSISSQQKESPPVESGMEIRNLPTQQPTICLTAKAMKRNPLQVATYWNHRPATVPQPLFPHVSEVLCERQREPHTTPKVKIISDPAESVLCFKAARTGSTFFTNVITETVRQTRRPTSMLFEPFCSKVCDGDTMDPKQQEHALQRLLTQGCTYPPNAIMPQSKCTPDKVCQPMGPNEYGNPVAITSLNPRFLNPQLDWSNVFGAHNKVSMAPRRPRIFALRRTNLVLMSYSKFHHGGCGGDRQRQQVQWNSQKRKRTRFFGFQTLLQCAQHYALGDQEISSSVALQASNAAGLESPMLIVYEDVMANGLLVQRHVLQHLGMEAPQHQTNNNTNNNMFQKNANTKKVHTSSLCIYGDVDCQELKDGLRDKYPCLYKQLVLAEEGHSWSVPMLPDGSVHIQGDCAPLNPQSDDSLQGRRLDELYQFPYESTASTTSVSQ